IDRHPEMVLRRGDFAGWRINWEDKARNLTELVADLNLGLQSVVFIDDNPIERARVRETLAEIFVPEWPTDKTLYCNALAALDWSVARIEDFVMSCRVMGRRIEESMLHVVATHARACGAETLVAEYLPTSKNAPILEFLERSGLHVEKSPHVFTWDLSSEYP